MNSRPRLLVLSAGAIVAVVVILVLRTLLPSAPPVAPKSPAPMAQAADARRGEAGALVVPETPAAGAGGEIPRSTLEFAGVVKFPDEMRFILTDRRTRKSSALLRLGEVFHDHQLSGFDAAAEVLTVQRDGNLIQLPLKTAQVKFGTAPPPPDRGIQFRIAIAADGSLSTDGRAISLEAFHRLLQDYGRNGSTLVVVVQQPPNPDAKIQEINKLISDAVGTSGAKKAFLRIVPAQAAK